MTKPVQTSNRYLFARKFVEPSRVGKQKTAEMAGAPTDDAKRQVWRLQVRIAKAVRELLLIRPTPDYWLSTNDLQLLEDAQLELPTRWLLEMLEPYDGKLSSTVLRGERGRKAPDPLGPQGP